MTTIHGTESTVVVYDQTNYSKTLEIHQKHQENFGFVELIAKRFCDIGLRDLAIESEFIAVGCV